MQEIYARLSKTGAVLCGRPRDDGAFVCDQPLAEVVRVRGAAGPARRRLVALDGWSQDKGGVWRRTTHVEDLRRIGIARLRPRPDQRAMIEFPALTRCPKCRVVQWLDPERLRVAGGADRRSPASRWVVWE